jgi:hypothetical protein
MVAVVVEQQQQQRLLQVDHQHMVVAVVLQKVVLIEFVKLLHRQILLHQHNHQLNKTVYFKAKIYFFRYLFL